MKRTICTVLCALSCLLLHAQEGLRVKTIVIDPGHGGKDPGAVSKDRKVYEKTLTLDISRKLADRIRKAWPDVKVVMTRSSDNFPQLEQRARTANDADADLFISIHINSTASTSANGYSVHVLGQSSNKNRDLYASNMEICRTENSVVMLEDDYTEKYQGFDPSDPASYIFMQLMQNSNLENSIHFAELVDREMKGGPILNARGVSQNPFLVLWMTSMPSVLVELGFISNSADLAVLTSEAKRNDIAERLFNAVKKYKESNEKAVSPTSTAMPQAAPSPTPSAVSAKRYGVQILASSRNISETDLLFGKFIVEKYQSGSLFKYVSGVSEDLQKVVESYPGTRLKYPDAFIVEITSDGLVRRLSADEIRR